MKSKRNQVILLLLVLTVWGLVAYRFFTFNEGETESLSGIEITEISKTNQKTSEYVFQLNYRDPFSINAQKESNIPKPRLSEDNSDLNSSQPVIEYLGLVHSGKKKTAILRVDGKTVIVSIGDYVNKMEVQDMSGSRLVLFGPELNSTRTIDKK